MTASREIWQTLARAGLVRGNEPVSDASSPWYVRALAGIGAWIAAGFVLAFLGMAVEFVFENEELSILVGLILAAVAAFVFQRAPRSTFAIQLGLATGFAGQALAVYGLVEAVRDDTAQWILVACLEGVLAVFIPNFVHRVCAALAVGVTSALALASAGAYELTAGLLTLAVAVVWLNEFEPGWRSPIVAPIGYGLTLSLLVVQSTFLRPSILRILGLSSDPALFPASIGNLLPGIVLVMTVGWLFRQQRHPLAERNALMAVSAAVVVAAISSRAPGPAAGMVIVLLGYANGSRTLLGLGFAATLGYLSAYYYVLDLTLLDKAMSLALAGGVLLIARWTLRRWLPAGVGSARA